VEVALRHLGGSAGRNGKGEVKGARLAAGSVACTQNSARSDVSGFRILGAATEGNRELEDPARLTRYQTSRELQLGKERVEDLGGKKKRRPKLGRKLS
jgi:hypothetical protein